MNLSQIFLAFFALFACSQLQIVFASSFELVKLGKVIDEVVSDFTPPKLTYKSILNRLKMRSFQDRQKLLLDSSPINPDLMVELIRRNYRAMRFSRSIANNPNLLYDLMKEEGLLQILGYEHCISLLHDLITIAKPNLKFFTVGDSVINGSLVMELTDFFEFILNELVPRYHVSEDSPEFDYEQKCLIEMVGLVYSEFLVNIKTVCAFNNAEFLKVYVRRFQRVWPEGTTANLLTECRSIYGTKRLTNLHLYRDILTFLIRSVPSYFINQQMAENYGFDGLKVNAVLGSPCQLMYYMAPIYRALLMLDPNSFVLCYLDRYKRLAQAFFEPSNQLTCLPIFNEFVNDSRFSVIPSQADREMKKDRLVLILEKFFYHFDCFELAYYCLRNSLLALYEVILQHFGESFRHDQQFGLLRYLLMEFVNSKFNLAASITLGYLPHLVNEELFSIFKQQNASNLLSERFKFINEQRLYLISCPLQDPINISRDSDDFNVSSDSSSSDNSSSISSSNKIIWSPPHFLEESDSNEPILYYHALALLCRIFGIPVYGISLFNIDSGLEGATWGEMIIFLNLCIELAAKSSSSYVEPDFETDENEADDRNRLVKFSMPPEERFHRF